MGRRRPMSQLPTPKNQYVAKTATEITIKMIYILHMLIKSLYNLSETPAPHVVQLLIAKDQYAAKTATEIPFKMIYILHMLIKSLYNLPGTPASHVVPVDHIQKPICGQDLHWNYL